MPDYVPILLRYILEESAAYFEAHLFPIATILLGVVGYIRAKLTYRNSFCPMVIPTAIDTKNRKVTVKNVGKWHAQTIQTPKMNQFIDFGGSVGIRECRLAFEDPAFLEPGESKELATVAYEEGHRLAGGSDMLFWSCINIVSGSNGKAKKVPFLIEYQDIDGTPYVTEAFIESAVFKSVKVRRDYFQRLRSVSSHLNYWRIKLHCKLINYRRGIHKKEPQK